MKNQAENIQDLGQDHKNTENEFALVSYIEYYSYF